MNSKIRDLANKVLDSPYVDPDDADELAELVLELTSVYCAHELKIVRKDGIPQYAKCGKLFLRT